MKATQLTYKQNHENDTYEISRECSNECGKVTTVAVAGPELFAYQNGEFVQTAFPNLSAHEREAIFQSGLCSECWDKLFKFDDEEDDDDEDGED